VLDTLCQSRVDVSKGIRLMSIIGNVDLSNALPAAESRGLEPRTTSGPNALTERCPAPKLDVLSGTEKMPEPNQKINHFLL